MSEEVKNEHNKQEETLYCECCSERIWDEDVYGNGNITLCHHYYHHNYTRCRGTDASGIAYMKNGKVTIIRFMVMQM